MHSTNSPLPGLVSASLVVTEYGRRPMLTAQASLHAIGGASLHTALLPLTARPTRHAAMSPAHSPRSCEQFAPLESALGTVRPVLSTSAPFMCLAIASLHIASPDLRAVSLAHSSVLLHVRTSLLLTLLAYLRRAVASAYASSHRNTLASIHAAFLATVAIEDADSTDSSFGVCDFELLCAYYFFEFVF
mmetsp:Transcript_10302/g.18912  ORF Transcript_10302/g.18912 Transcript_10302/m.18912 type:complete len:189 (+) Transcript_10302:689-1255(+)